MTAIELNFEVSLDLSFDLKDYIQKVLSVKNLSQGHYEFNFVTAKTIKAVNRAHLNKTYLTDIISFNLGSPEEPYGDLYICPEQVEKNAKDYGRTFESELKFVVIHGILHLLDYQDYTDEEKALMFAEQERIMELLCHA